MRRINRIKAAMNARQHLLNLIDAFAQAKGLSGSRVTTMAMNSGSVYRFLKDGKDITVGRLEMAVRWLSDNWPADTPWPEGIARPQPAAPAPSSDVEAA